SLLRPFSFSMAYNDYGFELLSDQEIPIEEAIENGFFTTERLYEDIQASVNSTEMARSKFRDIATISGMVFNGYPGAYIADKHLKSSSALFFDMFKQYDSDNLLLKQAYQEVMDFQLEESRLRDCLERIQNQKFIITYPEKPTPFAFPIMVDRLREKMSNESLEDRVNKMVLSFK
ncbi:MAG: DNA ligase-associated DEXH box helicase, partial [Cytophagales bacterium]